jgi:flagellin
MSGMSIATNALANSAYKNLKYATKIDMKASERLTTGKKINSAADDVSGMAISEKMQAQILGMRQAQENNEDAINLITVMDGGMDNIQDMMIRQRELLINGLNDTNTFTDGTDHEGNRMQGDKDRIQLELDMITSEIGMMADRVVFGSLHLLNVNNEPTVKTVVENITKQVSVRLGEFDFTAGGTVNFTITPVDSEITIKAPAPINETVTFPGNFGTSSGINIARTLNGTGGWDVTITAPPHAATAKWVIEAINNDENGLPADVLMNAPVDPGFTRALEDREIVKQMLHTVTTPGARPLWIQNGANSGMGQRLERFDCRPEALGIKNLVTQPHEAATKSLADLDKAFNKVNTYRAKAGAVQRRLEHASNFLGIGFMNLEQANSRIADADMAKETLNIAKGKVLTETTTALLAQANQHPISVMNLLMN